MSERERNIVPGAGSARESAWLPMIRAYLFWTIGAHLGWEIVQLPLYTIWARESPAYIAFAVLHCTAGDVLIAGSTLILSLVIIGSGAWPVTHFWPVVYLATATGVAITIYSEWLNTTVRLAWAYSEWMPVVPVLGTGLTPLAQWLVFPPLGLWLCRRRLLR